MATDVEQLVDNGLAARIGRIAERVTFSRVVSQLAPFVLAFAVYLAVFLFIHPDATGDEPHFLVIAQSIAYDGDIDLTNDYASRERTLRVVNVFPLDTNFQVAEHDGLVRPVRGVGLGAALAPAVAVGGLTGARIVMVLIAALLADQLFRLLRQLGFRRRYRVLGWSAVVFCMPILPFTSQIYPELPAALLVLVALRVMVSGGPSPAALALGSTAGAALIWLHVRFIPLWAGVFLGLALAACRRYDALPPGLGLVEGIRAAPVVLGRCVRTLVKQWRTVTLPLVIPYAIGLGLLIAAFQRWYGTPNPRAAYATFSDTTVGSGGWGFLYDIFLGDLFNPVVGWVPYVPVHWLGLAALGCVVVKFRWPAAACIAVAGGYELIVASVGANVGWGLPARYLIIVIPLIAVPLALVVQEIRTARIVFVPLLAVSLLYAAVAVNDYQGLFPMGEKPRMFGLRTTAAVFPNTRPPKLPTSYVLTPGQNGPQTGAVQGNTIVTKAGRDGPGFLLWGPYAPLKAGTYRARFPLTVTGVGSNEPVATIEAAGTPPWRLFARKVVTAGELKARFPSGVTLGFKTPGGYMAETRLFYAGKGTMRAGPVVVEREGAAVSGSPGRFPNWPLVLLWVAGTLVAGWLLVRAMKANWAAHRS
jgi:hypothetical protein